MTALQYLECLIAGQKMSTIPVQISELEMLKHLIVAEKK